MINMFPKVMIIGEQFDLVRGGGITLTNLFSDWPKDKLAVAGFNEPSVETLVKAGAFYLLGKDEFCWPWPFSRLIRQSASGPREVIENTQQETSSSSSTTQQVSKPTRAGVLFARTLALLGTDGLLPFPGKPNKFLDWVRFQNPDIIYAQVASLQMIRFVADLTRSSGKPLVLHQMDDWVPVLYGAGLLGNYCKQQSDVLYKELSQLATARMSISTAMGESYAQRYGGEWLAFHNPIDLDRFSPTARKSWVTRKKTFRIWYGGRVGWGNREGVAEIGQVVAELRNEGVDIVLDICTSQVPDEDMVKIGKYDGVYFRSFVPNAQIPEALASADLLYLPLDWDESSLIRAKLSMPTKASEYMASGTPTLVYAPTGNALTRYANDEKWAYVVSEHSTTTLKAAIVKLIGDEELREQIGRRGIEVANRNHGASGVREKFRCVLSSAADQSNKVN